MSGHKANRRIQEALEQGATELDLSGCGLTTLPESIGQADDEPFVVLAVVDPATGRRYMVRVPPDTRTCQQAAAW